jgi:SAM-dependent methyltransferase
MREKLKRASRLIASSGTGAPRMSNAKTTVSQYDPARRILLGPNPWLLESCKIENSIVKGNGWALPGHELPKDFVFSINGRPADFDNGVASPDILRVFPFFPSSKNARFQFEFKLEPEDLDRGFVEIAYCNAYTKDPLYCWHNTFIPLRDSKFGFPREDQLLRTQGNTSLARFNCYGFTTFMRIDGLLQTYFRLNLRESPLDILDWGCGCGRITRHLLEYSAGRVTACDIDQENIDWCSSNLPGGAFFSVPLLPPLHWKGKTFDLIIGISVFTHLSKEAEAAWAKEIAAILKPGGIAVVTVHGLSGIARILDDDRLQQIFQRGSSDTAKDARLRGKISDDAYYRATFHTPSAAVSVFGGLLRHVATVPSGNALVQDFLLFQKLT